MNISHRNSQCKYTNSKGEFVLKTCFKCVWSTKINLSQKYIIIIYGSSKTIKVKSPNLYIMKFKILPLEVYNININNKKLYFSITFIYL